MRLLLDTNALIWLISDIDGDSLGTQAKVMIRQADIVYVSAISIVEIRIKTMLGKLGSKPDLLADIIRAGCLLTDYSAHAADAVTGFPELVRHDPFDRMLLTQAKTEGLTLMTADQTLLNLGLDFVIDARV